MKIAIVGPVYPYRGGIAHYTAQMADFLHKAGHAVQVISFKRQYPAWLYPGESDKDPSQQPLRVEAEYLLDPLYPWTWQAAIRTISAQRPDLAVIHWWTTFWGPAFAWLAWRLHRNGVKVAYLIHNVLPHEQRFFDPLLARLALRQADGYIAQTEKEKKRLLDLVARKQVEVCPLPAYSLLTEMRMPRQAARQRLDIDEQRPLFLFFGIVREYKGLRVLLQAMVRLKDLSPRPYLLVAGEIWEDKAAYHALIDQLGLGGMVRLEDRYVPDEEAAVMFSAADGMLAPYIDGTQSAAAGMAIGFGLPLIVTDIVASGIAEHHRQSVLVIRAGDIDALAGAMRAFINNPPPRQPAAVQTEVDWKRLESALRAFYEMEAA